MSNKDRERSSSKEDNSYRRSSLKEDMGLRRNSDSSEESDKCYSRMEDNNKKAEELKQLSKDCNRLRAERNRLKDEKNSLKNENKYLTKKYNNEIKDQKAINKSLAEEVIRIRAESEEWKKKFSDSDNRYNSFGKAVEAYKQRRKLELNKLETELESERDKNKGFVLLNNKLIKEKEEINHKLGQEIKKNNESIGSQRVVNYMEERIGFLETETINLKNKLSNELQKNKELIEENESVVHLKETVIDLKQRLKNQVMVNSKQSDEHKSEVFKLKNSHNLQITSLKKQRMYFQNCNETNKRKHLATQYLHSGHEKMYKKNASDIHESVEKNTNQVMTELREEIIGLLDEKNKKLKFANTLKIADVVRNNITGSEQIHNSAKKVTEKRADGLVVCPDCERTFDDITNLKKHLTLKHFKRFDSKSDATVEPKVEPNKHQNKVLDSIDISDD